MSSCHGFLLFPSYARSWCFESEGAIGKIPVDIRSTVSLVSFHIVSIRAFEVPKRLHVNASETCFAKADDVHPGADLVVFK